MKREGHMSFRRPPLSRRTLAWVAVGQVLAVVLALAACNTPFIPIPPPGDPTFTPIAGQGAAKPTWEVRGGPNAGMVDARVFVWNRRLAAGLIARADQTGAYVASPLEADIGDPVEISYETPKGERSETICRPLQAGTTGVPCSP
jgi:hypothetical protein